MLFDREKCDRTGLSPGVWDGEWGGSKCVCYSPIFGNYCDGTKKPSPSERVSIHSIRDGDTVPRLFPPTEVGLRLALEYAGFDARTSVEISPHPRFP